MIIDIKSINEKIKCFCRSKFAKIIEINEKYSHPKIGMTPTVKFSLLLLRAYLIFLLLLLMFKFFMIIK